MNWNRFGVQETALAQVLETDTPRNPPPLVDVLAPAPAAPTRQVTTSDDGDKELETAAQAWQNQRPSPYALLGLRASKKHSDERVKEAFLKVAATCHPSLGQGDARFVAVSKAYSLIKDKASREAHAVSEDRRKTEERQKRHAAGDFKRQRSKAPAPLSEAQASYVERLRKLMKREGLRWLPHRDVPQSTTDHLSQVQQGVPNWVSARAAINAQKTLRWIGDGPSGVILEGSSGGVPAETAQRELVEDLHAWLLAIEAAERSCSALQPFYDLFPHHAFLNCNLESAVKSDRRLVWRPGTSEYQGIPRIGVALQDMENDRRHKNRCDGELAANAVSDAIVAKRVPGFMEAFRRFVYESRGREARTTDISRFYDWLPDRSATKPFPQDDIRTMAWIQRHAHITDLRCDREVVWLPEHAPAILSKSDRTVCVKSVGNALVDAFYDYLLKNKLWFISDKDAFEQNVADVTEGGKCNQHRVTEKIRRSVIQQRGPPKIQWVGYDGGGKAVLVWRPANGVVKRSTGCVAVGVAGGVAVSANSVVPKKSILRGPLRVDRLPERVH